MSGKGDAYRPVDRKKYASNWDRIFAISKPRETLDRGTEKAVDRCPNTIDIEEQIEQDRGTD